MRVNSEGRDIEQRSVKLSQRNKTVASDWRAACEAFVRERAEARMNAATYGQGAYMPRMQARQQELQAEAQRYAAATHSSQPRRDSYNLIDA